MRDIKKLLRSRRDMARSNEPQPTNGLPPEIISFIAGCVLEGEVDTKAVVPLTHVCQYWRNAIISAPGNWTLISNECGKLAGLSLERAKIVPLTVSLNVDRLKPQHGLINLLRKPGFLDLLLPHFHNIVSLSCSNFSAMEELTQALPTFPKSMHNLRSLTLTRHGRAQQSVSPDPFDFSAHKVLRELSLYNIPLSPSILRIRTLTELTLLDCHFELHIDTLLNFLEKSHSLQSASLMIKFTDPSLCHTRRQTPVGNQLHHLSISGDEATTIQALVSGIALRTGASLEIHHSGNKTGLTGILSGVSMAHLSNLSSPASMEYRPYPRNIRLFGPDGSFSYKDTANSDPPFGEFHLLPITGIRELRLECRGSWILKQFRLSSFPSLEVLAIDGGRRVSFLSPALPNPAYSPFLKTLALLNCVIAEEFMADLAQAALNRENSASTSLHRVVIINSEGKFPTAASVERLREYVSTVEVLEGTEFPRDLL